MKSHKTSNKKTNQDITIATYEKMAQNYVNLTSSKVSGVFKDYIDDFLSRVPKNAKILEIGSATGRDADYIEEHGYHVTRTDVAESFIKYQKGLGKEIEKFDAIDGDLDKQFDLIIATAVLLHFNHEQFSKALENIKRHMSKEGLFAFAVKEGEGEEFTSAKMGQPRYFLYWKTEDLQKELVDHGFNILKIINTPDKKWIHCIVNLSEKN